MKHTKQQKCPILTITAKSINKRYPIIAIIARLNMKREGLRIRPRSYVKKKKVSALEYA